MVVRVLDPTHELKAAGVQPAARPSSMRRGNGTPSSPASAIEGVVHRAVCTTQSQLSGKGCRPWP
jgi:hypothetical protein